MPRMQILTASEYKAFDAPPVVSYAERDIFFQVSKRLNAILATLRNPTNRVGLVLTVGYFRATKRFFTPLFDPTDMAYSRSDWPTRQSRLILRPTIPKHRRTGTAN